jgi:Nucleotidyl transferase AbiEii toxin, Type IV TA system
MAINATDTLIIVDVGTLGMDSAGLGMVVGKADQTSLLALVKDCATLEVEADGLTFLANSAVAEEITKDSEYKGARILMNARMDNVRLRIQIDFGVGDVIVPGPRMVEYPVFLGNDTIHLLAYPVESAIAEELQAMVALGTANSRMKDFYVDRLEKRCFDILVLRQRDRKFRIQSPTALPIAGPESSCTKWTPGTVTSVWFAQVRQKSRDGPERTMPGSALMNSFRMRVGT